MEERKLKFEELPEVNSPRWLSKEDLEGEEWRDVVGYEGRYKVSDYGRVVSLGRVVKRSDGKPYSHSECIMRHRINHWGYHIVPLSIKNGANKQRRYMLHRIVAMSFIPNPQHYPQINHIDGNKNNNSPSNLEWCTNSMNQIHAWKLGLNRYTGKNDVKIIQMDDEGNELKVWGSLHEVERFFGKPLIGHLWGVLNGKRKHCMGYKWKYYDKVQ